MATQVNVLEFLSRKCAVCGAENSLWEVGKEYACMFHYMAAMQTAYNKKHKFTDQDVVHELEELRWQAKAELEDVLRVEGE